MFDIPIVIFLFRRTDTLKRIFERLEYIQPRKVYLLADCGRNEEEKHETDYCREYAESLVTWDCEIIRNYADHNRGVYRNIGEGARWVFERESEAIFIEDDNLPEVTFFRYCKELLEKYKSEEKILWICGTNYYKEITSEYSYCFTKHLLPCGWASWSHKFLKYYDGELQNLSSLKHRVRFFTDYYPKLLSLVQYQSILNEEYRKNRYGNFLSWDYQMLWSVRSNDFYGIMPMCNQITNIGVDNYSIHGGNDKSNVMTDRFCEVPSKALKFPLEHPERIELDPKIEKMIGKIICPPSKRAFFSIIGSKLKHLLGSDTNVTMKQALKGKR